MSVTTICSFHTVNVYYEFNTTGDNMSTNAERKRKVEEKENCVKRKS